jgi:hypothetical protein
MRVSQAQKNSQTLMRMRQNCDYYTCFNDLLLYDNRVIRSSIPESSQSPTPAFMTDTGLAAQVDITWLGLQTPAKTVLVAAPSLGKGVGAVDDDDIGDVFLLRSM